MKLNFQTIDENTRNLLPAGVYEYVTSPRWAGQFLAAEIDPEFADGESLSREYDIPYEMELNCLVVEGRRKDVVRYAAVVVPYGKRASMNARVRNPLDAKEVKLADLNYVTEVTGMEYGSITPVGLPADWMILVDSSVFDQEYVIVGGGLVNSKLMFPARLFKEFPGCVVIEGLARE